MIMRLFLLDRIETPTFSQSRSSRTHAIALAVAAFICAFPIANALAQCPFNVSGHAQATALRDGVLLTRIARGQKGDALVQHVDTASSSVALLDRAAAVEPQLDVDGNGVFDEGDAAIIVRYLLGFRGDALAHAVMHPGARRNSAAQIAQFIGNGCVPELTTRKLSEMPRSNGGVFISTFEQVEIDQDIDLEWIEVQGNLRCAKRDLNVRTRWLIVHGGRVQCGTPLNPHASALVLTLKGAASNEDALGLGMGTKVLGVMHGGQLDLHGISAQKTSWTQLSATAQAGAAQISTIDNVSWVPGDKIVVAPSGFDAREADVATITSVAGNTIHFSPALQFPHYGEIELVDGKPLDMRAEVGLLTRNIRIEGDETSQTGSATYPIGFGGHSMFMAGSTVRISGVEFFRMGQTGRVGRYPAHWHLAADGSDDSFRNNSIHKSFHRGVVAHSVNHLTVENNVSFDVFSHAYTFSEVGDEEGNRFVRNLSVLVKKLEQADFAFPRDDHSQSDQGEIRPAGFWGRNYYNALLNNHSAGAIDGVGFLFELVGVEQSVKQFMTRRTDAIEFSGNLAHSNDMPGATNPHYGPRTRGHGLMLSRYQSEDNDIVFSNFSTYKNGNAGIWVEDTFHVIDGAVIGDSAQGIIVMASQIRNSVMTQRTANTIGGVLGVNRQFMRGGGALPGGIHVRRSTYGTEFRVDNVSIIDFVDAGIVIHKETSPDEGNFAKNVKLVRTPRFYWDGTNAYTGTVRDLDGTLTGASPSIISKTALPNSTFNATFNAYITPQLR
jgi:hypothetical protein